MQSVLITGGTGFIGLHLARALAARVRRLVLCDLPERGGLDGEAARFLEENPRVEYRSCDLLDRSALECLGKNNDAVFHLAAVVGVDEVERDPIKVVKNNVIGTLNLLEWFSASASTRLVFSSTSEVYAGGYSLGVLPVPTPETAPVVTLDAIHPRASYGLSKLVGEHAVAHYARRDGFEFTIVRYHNIYGPRMGMKHVIPQMFQRLASGENPFVVRSPGHTRSFCFVEDAVRATVSLAAEPGAIGKTIHIGDDQEELSILELAWRMAQVVGVTPDIRPGQDQANSVARRCPDVTLLRQLTGYKPEVALDEGLKRTFAWYHPRLEAAAR